MSLNPVGAPNPTLGETILKALKAVAGYTAEGIADAVAVWDTARQAVRTVAGAVASAATQNEVNKALARYQDVPLSPAVLADAVIRNIMSEEAATAEAAFSGLNAERFATMVTDTGESYGIIDALRLWHRGSYLAEIVPTGATGAASYPYTLGGSLGGTYGITQPELDKVIYYSRVRDEFIPDLLKLSYNTMSPADAIGVAIKGRMDPADAKQLFLAGGGMPEQWDLLYEAAGDSMGVVGAVMLHHRGYITDAELEDVLYQSRINPRFYPLVKLQYLHFLAPYQIAQAVKSGVVDAETANKWLLESGYPADQAAAFASTEAAGTIHTAKAETEGMILADYEAQIITEAEATQALTALGYIPSAIPFVLETYAARRVIAMRNAAITRLRLGFLAGAVSVDDVRTDLGTLGVPPAAVDSFLQAWRIELATPTKRLTMAQVGKLLEEGHMTSAEGVAYWERLGYTGPDTAWLLLLYPPGSKAPPAPAPTTTAPAVP